MNGSVLDVVGVGNAIVDVLARTSDEFLVSHGLIKGSMTLIDEARARELYAQMGPALEASGGSAANTIATIASLGGSAGYIGCVCNDQLGEIFAHDLRAMGIHYAVPPRSAGPATARCLILVTADAQRTMNTYLGACVTLGPEDIDDELIRNSKITYLEGYLWDRPSAKQAFIKAARVAKASGRKVALSLSDSFCVSRHRDSFLDLVAHHVDILFANEAEISALYQTDSFEVAVRSVRGQTEFAALTRGAKGSVLVSEGDPIYVPAEPVTELVDTTGAGDAYAAGVLLGLTRGEPLAACGKSGSQAAARVLGHYGARPVRRLEAATVEGSAGASHV